MFPRPLAYTAAGLADSAPIPDPLRIREHRRRPAGGTASTAVVPFRGCPVAFSPPHRPTLALTCCRKRERRGRWTNSQTSRALEANRTHRRPDQRAGALRLRPHTRGPLYSMASAII